MLSNQFSKYDQNVFFSKASLSKDLSMQFIDNYLSRKTKKQIDK